MPKKYVEINGHMAELDIPDDPNDPIIEEIWRVLIELVIEALRAELRSGAWKPRLRGERSAGETSKSTGSNPEERKPHQATLFGPKSPEV